MEMATHFGARVAGQTDRGLIVAGDALEALSLVPDESVSLILTDPPYHSTKKANITGDRDFAADDDYIEWMGRYAQEWQRILKASGSLYVFCASDMSARLEVRIGEHLKPLSHITWTKPNDPGFDGWKGKMQKDALRRWYPHSERILFFEKSEASHPRRSVLGRLLREIRVEAGISAHALTEQIGAYGKVNHGGAVSNWETGRNIPSRDQWDKIVAVLEGTGRVRRLPSYEDAVRPFHMSGELEFTDVWDFPSVRPYNGKHPAEKPVSLLTHIVETSSYEGDLVLDCFCGSGATLDAAIRVGRSCIGLELEDRWVQASVARLTAAEKARGVTTSRQFADRRRRKTTSGQTLL
jgi:adenine-specific DNA-methyltransferase